MINPNLLKPTYEKMKHVSLPGGKVYFAVVGRRCRRGKNWLVFKTASLAEEHAKKVHKAWVRLYNQAIRLQVTENLVEAIQ